jgi:hypothetical protein
MEREKKDFLSVRRMPRDSFERRKSGNRSIQGRVEQLACERDGDLPVWVRAPKCGREFYSGCSRPKLYEWAAKGHIRSVSIREPGRIKGVRLFHLASILEFIERCEVKEQATIALRANSACCPASMPNDASEMNPS